VTSLGLLPVVLSGIKRCDSQQGDSDNALRRRVPVLYLNISFHSRPVPSNVGMDHSTVYLITFFNVAQEYVNGVPNFHKIEIAAQDSFDLGGHLMNIRCLRINHMTAP